MAISSPTSELREALRAALLADVAVVGLVENRVYTAHGRDTEEATRVHPVLILDFRGGSSLPSAPVQQRRVDVYGYSNRSAGQSEQVYVAARAALQNRGLHSGKVDALGDPCPSLCVYATETSGPVDGWNSLVDAWFTRGTFRILGWG